MQKLPKTDWLDWARIFPLATLLGKQMRESKGAGMNQNEIQKAKPCPFCGEEPAFSGDPSEWQDDNRYVELSLGCCASMREVIGWQRAREMSVKQRRDELESRLISRWNDRSRAEEQREEAHPDDVAVDNFAVAMKDKLAHSRDKGRDGWERCSRVELSRMLREHVDKGDPINVANFCMFLWSLRQPIEPSVAVNEQLLEVIETVANNLGEFAGQMETQQKADQITAYASELFAAAESAKGAV